MEIVDARAYVSPVWFMPLESLIGEMSRSGVARAVLVPIEGDDDNAYRLEALQRYPEAFAIVVALDTASPDAPSTLTQLAQRGAAGVRLPVAGRSPGGDPLAIWRTAAEVGLVVSCTGTPAEISSAAFARIVETFPQLRFVVEHAGGAVQSLARFPNVFVRFGGLGEFAKRLPVVQPFPFATPVPPLLETLYDAFGPRRLMWGSEYPLVNAREGYANGLAHPLERFASKSPEDRDWMFGRTAEQVFFSARPSAKKAAARRPTPAAAAPAPPQRPFEVYDVHVHASNVWYVPIETVVAEMDRAGVAQGVLCQQHGQFDNDYQFEAARRYPGRFATIVHLDVGRPDAAELLKRYAERGAAGVRIRPHMRSAGADPLAIWKAAAECGLSISCFGHTMSDILSDEFARIVRSIPDTPIVLEHQAGDYISSVGVVALDEVKRAFELARFSNTYVMIGGLGEFAERATPIARPLPFVQPIPPVLDLAYDAFGPQRMMWGSDYPVSGLREGYANALDWPLEYLNAKSIDDRAWIFGRTGRSVFPIKDSRPAK